MQLASKLIKRSVALGALGASGPTTASNEAQPEPAADDGEEHDDEFSDSTTHFKFMTGWLVKKGRNRRTWKKRWFVLAGPFLMYYESPEHQVAHELIDDSVLFLKGYKLIDSAKLAADAQKRKFIEANGIDINSLPELGNLRNYSSRVTERIPTKHPAAFVLQSYDRELYMEAPDNSDRSHTSYEWMRYLRRAIETANGYENLEAAKAAIFSIGSGTADREKTPLSQAISDAAFAHVFSVTLPREQHRMLSAMNEQLVGLVDPSLQSIVAPNRWLTRCGVLKMQRHAETGSLEPEALVQACASQEVQMFLFNDMLLIVEPDRAHPSKLRYLLHRYLTEVVVESSMRTRFGSYRQKPGTGDALGGNTFVIRMSAIHSSAERMERLSFEAASPELAHAWKRDLKTSSTKRQQPTPALERYEGAVIFADVSGFSRLGDVLERREKAEAKRRDTQKQLRETYEEAKRMVKSKVPGSEPKVRLGADPTQEIGGGDVLAPTAAEDLAKFLGKETERMVKDVTMGGGDVIKFAGDCVIAVFPAEDYKQLSLDSERKFGKHYTAMQLAAGQATAVSVQMAMKQHNLILQAQGKADQQDEVARLVSELDIHVAIGAGMVYGYHVGGQANKWEYLIDGPVMGQVRSADDDAGAGEVVLSRDAFKLVNEMHVPMKTRKLDSGNAQIWTYFGPTNDAPFMRPWESCKPPRQVELTQCLTQYVPQPVVDAVESGMTGSTDSHKKISTIFCRLIGIDYETDAGEVAVMELGAITCQIQLILRAHNGTLTRVISDDKGTSMLLSFRDAADAVRGALEIKTSVQQIPVRPPQAQFQTAMGITTGVVFIGCVGGMNRQEYTMHGSVVNFAARLMCCPLIKYTGGILCDRKTREETSELGLVYKEQEPQQFKGFKDLYAPFMPMDAGMHLSLGKKPTLIRKKTSRRVNKSSSACCIANEGAKKKRKAPLPIEEDAAEATVLDASATLHKFTEAVNGWKTLLSKSNWEERESTGLVVIVPTSKQSGTAGWDLDPIFKAAETLSSSWLQLDLVAALHASSGSAAKADTAVSAEDDSGAMLAQRHFPLKGAEGAGNKDYNINMLETLHSTGADGFFWKINVIENAETLDADGWELLEDICTSARHLQSKCHGIVVLAIDFESELGSTLAGMGEYRKFCDSTHAIEQTSASDEGALQRTPSKKSGRRRQATNMMGGMGGTGHENVYTLKVAAVIASDTADQDPAGYGGPHWDMATMMAVHPYVLNKTWGEDRLMKQISFWQEEEELRLVPSSLVSKTLPSGKGPLRKRASTVAIGSHEESRTAADDATEDSATATAAVYVFADRDTQQDRYKELVHAERVKIHRHIVQSIEYCVSGKYMDPESLRRLIFHSRGAQEPELEAKYKAVLAARQQHGP